MKRLKTILLVILYVRDLESFKFTEIPQDTAILKQQTAQFKCALTCSADCNGLVWAERVTSDTGNDVDIYYQDGGTFNENNPNRERYAIVKGTTNLLVRNVNENDAGRYICKPDRGGGVSDSKIAFLTVMKKSTCKSNVIVVEGENVTIECSVVFYNSSDYDKMPSISWNTTDQSEKRSDTSVTSTGHFMARSDDNGRSFTCQTYFESPPPHYTDTCNTSVNVTFGPRPIEIKIENHSDFSNVRHGNVLICSSLGNPDPGITWHKVNGTAGPTNSMGSKFTVTRKMKGNYTYTCEAKNTLINQDVKSAAKDISFVVTGTGNSSNQSQKYGVLYVMLILRVML